MSHTQSETQKKKEEELVNIFINNPDIQAAQSSLRMRFILRKKESLLHRYVRSYNRVLVTKSCKIAACDTNAKTLILWFYTDQVRGRWRYLKKEKLNMVILKVNRIIT